MRLLALAACVVALSAPLAAQIRFTDPEFDLSITIPEGMRELTYEERAATLGFEDPELARNVPRSEGVAGEWMNNYVWIDLGPADRFVHLTIFDHVPFASPQEYIDAMGELTPVLENGKLEPAEGGPAVWVERRFVGASGIERRLRQYYYVDPGNQRSLSIKLQSRESAWDEVEPELLAILDTLDWERRPAQLPPGAGAQTGMPGMTTAAPGAQRSPASVAALPSTADAGDYAPWVSREALGSMILAGVLLLGLLFGGRGG